MRKIILVAALACLGSALLNGQDSASPTIGHDVEVARRNVRDVADRLKPTTARPPNDAVPKNWKPARTSWGDPEIEGVYTNTDEWGVPFERPAEFEGRTLDSITPAELATVQQARRDALLERLATQAPAEPGTIGWYDNLNARNSRAWLIVDPPDGRLPPLTSAGRRRADAAAESQSRPRATDSYADRGNYERCITRGFPGSMIPEAYGNAYQIHQAPGWVVIRYEQIHETRVIPVDPRRYRPLAAPITSYMGYARGWWESETLVVETTRFRNEMTLSPGSVRTAFRGFDPAGLRLTERFTPVGPRAVEWSVRVDDSGTWTRPWTFAMRLTKVDASQQPYEYACHEGNYGIRNGLAAARAAEEGRR
jgi:hypothetical protein